MAVTLSPLRTITISNYFNFLTLLRLCQKPEQLQPLKSLLIVHGLLPHKPYIANFIEHCFHLGASRLALSTLQLLQKPSLSLQNLLIRNLCYDNMFDDVLIIYRKYRTSGCPSDNYTFPFVIKASSALNNVHFCKTVHGIVLKNAFAGNVVVQTALIDFYSRVGEIGNAYLLLDSISKPDLVAYNALISGCSFNGFNDEVFKVFKEMCKLGLKPNVSTLASVIPVCSRLEKLELGRCLHGLAMKAGLFMDSRLVPAFISTYAGCGDLLTAEDIFDCVLEKNVTICNALLSAYTRHQKGWDGFQLFQNMLRDGIRPSMITFVSLIPSYESWGSIWTGESLHGCVIKFGFEHQASVLTTLLSMYGKLGELDSAEYIFNLMPRRSHLLWNSMISVCGSNGQWRASMAMFHEMQLSGFVPDAVSIVAILSSCSKLEVCSLGKPIHAFCLKRGFNADMNASNALLASYCYSGDLATSFKLFNRMVETNTVTWNTLITGCVKNGEAESAFWLLCQMQKEAVDFDLITLVSVLPACRDSEKLVVGMAIHAHASKTGWVSDVSLVNALISMYVNCGELKAGDMLFEKMPIRNIISWNALITGYRWYNSQQDTMCLFNCMIKENRKPNYVTLVNILPACYTLSQGKAIHAYAIKGRFETEIPLLTSLMLMYARLHNIKSCLVLFRMGESRNISLWNAVITALVHSRNAKAAVRFFNQLVRREMNLDHVTILSLMPACVQLNDLHFSNSMLAYIFKKGFFRDVTISNAMIDLYARCGDISFSKKLFDLLPKKDSFSWSVMINGYGLHGDGESAFTLLREMGLSGFRPDDITYLSVLSACSHGGLIEQASTVFTSMIHEGILPRMEHYACLIDLISRKGCLVDAHQFIKKLPQDPSTNLLESLLGACQAYGNVELGEEVGKLLLGMSPKSSGAYVILYNIYALAGRWTDANMVRSEMEKNQLRKIPGYSHLHEWQA